MTLEQLKRRSESSSSGKITFKKKEVKELIDKLEVLEILKNNPRIPLQRIVAYIQNSKKYGWTLQDHQLSNYDIDLEEEDFEKIKEWLEK